MEKICEDKGEKCNSIDTAARRGHLVCLMWARKYWDFSWSEDLCVLAASRGHLDCLMWARKIGHGWYDTECSYGASCNGHISCLRWILKSEGKWDYNTIIEGAKYGYLECLIIAEKFGNNYRSTFRLPYAPYMCSYAYEHGYMHIVMWLHKTGYICNCLREIYETWNGWKEGENKDCNICLEKLDESTVKFCRCRHHYHKECMNMMLWEMKKMNKKKGCSICERGK